MICIEDNFTFFRDWTQKLLLFNPEWPEPSVSADERLGAETETYLVFFKSGGDNYTYDTSDMQEWQRYDIGSDWQLEVNTIGGVLSVEP